MKRIIPALVVLGLMLAVCGCELFGPANSPATAAKVLTQASYTGKTGTPKQVSARSFTTAVPDFAGSAFAADATLLTSSIALVFGDVTITQDGRPYTVSGTLNYALGITALTPDVVFTAVLYGSGISIMGDDYAGTADVDLEEVVTFTPDGNGGGTMSGTVTGTVNGTAVNNPVSFTF